MMVPATIASTKLHSTQSFTIAFLTFLPKMQLQDLMKIYLDGVLLAFRYRYDQKIDIKKCDLGIPWPITALSLAFWMIWPSGTKNSMSMQLKRWCSTGWMARTPTTSTYCIITILIKTRINHWWCILPIYTGWVQQCPAFEAFLPGQLFKTTRQLHSGPILPFKSRNINVDVKL